MTESTEKKNPSTDSICLTQQVQGGQLPPCPPPPVSYSSGMTMAITFSQQNDAGHAQALFSIEKISYS